jgi:hypothetical protein
MKRGKGFVLTILILLGCGAAFGQVKLGFLSDDMSFQYCDFEEFVIYSGGFAAGIDAQGDCNAQDAILIGVKDMFPPSNLPVTGTVYVLADSAIDAGCDCFTGDQAILITQTKAYNIHAPHFGWEVLFNLYDSYYAYLNNWGYLTNTLPDHVAEGPPKRSLVQSLSQNYNAMSR